MNKMFFLPMSLLPIVIAIGGVPSHARAEDGEQLARQVCATCHGARGHSESPMFPRLSAQTPEYLTVQLKGFREHTRGETHAREYMWGIASRLDDATIASLAAYYSHQEPVHGKAGNAALMARGKDIFEHGVPHRGTPACASCHGPQGQGAGAFPRLAGQHVNYLLRQIEFFKNETRANSPVMTAVAHTLDADDANAVATWLESQ
ncbi:MULTISPECIES: cytochrome c [unclassified Burkholderia]|uniref:c-type cytochrome n=1 Tax=unclassified Burkholderia TaxID=2613784 RepID=UPI000F5614D0|nr:MULTISPECIES: c-type cytochrome [unclassified Burkholderia]RQR35145.1 cytochrome c4 [Burkholderia sp. Bp9131]RQR69042.1 cytochrome c4 [Burkholderia sp. Bp9015]RQR78984.1 cytochrome c4 [Burkholderia sp. Bp9011]RQR89181.1 cytochrome c4 [Burkholderia sp. Bp9010]RQS04311.1 cytochrome c4 [Burkholderia sp. Bp8991]